MTSTVARAGLIGGAALTLWLSAAPPIDGTGRKFYDDDPITRVPESQDASGAQPEGIDLFGELVLNLFSRPGDKRSDVRAQNINTVDEVPDSSWFTNRIYARPVSIEELTRGPNSNAGPAGRLTVIMGKSAGIAPGFTVRDEKEEVWFLSFDPRGTPRAPTAAIAVACRLFWALGYHQVESHLIVVPKDSFTVADRATIEPRSGYKRRMTMDDVARVLDTAAVDSDGSVRAIAGRAVPGKVLGGFRYYGTRPDDPNDLVPHEHRRELRALKVFGAWTNLVDMKAGNTLDTVIMENGRGVVRHYLQDVGSTFGSAAEGHHDWDQGYEYVYEGGPLWKRLVSFGFYLRPWQLVPYADNQEVGPFEGDQFEPEAWRTRVPNPAVLRARDDDTFWAALRVMAFTDDMIRAVTPAGEFADPSSATLLADVLIKRRDKIGKVYLPKVNPLIDFALSDTEGLTFENAAVRARVANAPPDGYRAVWSRFDNMTSESTPLGDPTSGSGGRLPAPAGLPRTPGAYVKVQVSAHDPAHPAWSRPVDVYFRRTADGWKLVGLERLPETPAQMTGM